MKARLIIKELMKKRGHTFQSLANKLGYKTASGVSERLRHTGDMSVTVLIQYLEAMDCELIVKSRLDDKTVWKVDNKEE